MIHKTGLYIPNIKSILGGSYKAFSRLTEPVYNFKIHNTLLYVFITLYLVPSFYIPQSHLAKNWKYSQIAQEVPRQLIYSWQASQ